MINDKYNTEPDDLGLMPANKWYRKVIGYEFGLHFRVSVARTYLEEAFASPSDVYATVLKFKVKHLRYTGSTLGNQFSANITFMTAKGRPTHDVAGELFENGHGPQMKLFIRDQLPPVYAAVILLVISFFSIYNRSVYALPPFLLFFGLFWFLGRKFLNYLTANSLASALKRIMSEQVQ